MKILRLATRAFRGLADGEHTFGDGERPASLTVVDGAPGSGKTSLLDAIACAKELVGSYGPPLAAEALLRRGASEGHLEATWSLNDAERTFAETEQATWTFAFPIRAGRPFPLCDPGVRRLFSSHPVKTPPGCGGLELFDAERSLPWAMTSRDEDTELTVRARRGPNRYGGLLPWLVRRVVQDGVGALDAMHRGGFIARWDRPDGLADVRDGLRQLAPDLHLERVEPTPAPARVWLARRDGTALELPDLADGDRMRLLFALAIRRYALESSVLLVDDVDRASSSDGRGELLRGLGEVVPDAQLVVTTRSPSTAELPKHRRIVLGGVS